MGHNAGVFAAFNGLRAILVWNFAWDPWSETKAELSALGHWDSYKRLNLTNFPTYMLEIVCNEAGYRPAFVFSGRFGILLYTHCNEIGWVGFPQH